jgi:hypothetical protein
MASSEPFGASSVAVCYIGSELNPRFNTMVFKWSLFHPSPIVFALLTASNSHRKRRIRQVSAANIYRNILGKNLVVFIIEQLYSSGTNRKLHP